MRDPAAALREYIRLERKSGAEGLAPDELRRFMHLKRQLSQRFAPGLSDEHADRRASVRVPARLRVAFHSKGELRQSLLTNLSRGGLFVETDHLLRIGTRMDLLIRIEEGDETLQIPVEVVSHNVGPQMKGGRRGMGVSFLPLSPEEQKRIDDLYERSLRRAASGADGKEKSAS